MSAPVAPLVICRATMSRPSWVVPTTRCVGDRGEVGEHARVLLGVLLLAVGGDRVVLRPDVEGGVGGAVGGLGQGGGRVGAVGGEPVGVELRAADLLRGADDVDRAALEVAALGHVEALRRQGVQVLRRRLDAVPVERRRRLCGSGRDRGDDKNGPDDQRAQVHGTLPSIHRNPSCCEQPLRIARCDDCCSRVTRWWSPRGADGGAGPASGPAPGALSA